MPKNKKNSKMSKFAKSRPRDKKGRFLAFNNAVFTNKKRYNQVQGYLRLAGGKELLR